MAAAAKVIFKGQNKLIVNVTGAYSAADETDTVVIDKSTLVGPDGVNPPSKIRIDEITWAVGSGFDYVLLEWDTATDEVIDYFQGQGFMDYFASGGGKAPAAVDGTGDVVLTTSGGASGDTYSLLISCTLKK